jgi:acyl carrier protein
MMNSHMSTLQTLQTMMCERFDLKAEDLAPDVRLEALGLDSLSVIEFMFHVEDEFHIKLPNEMVEIKTLSDIASVVERLMAEQNPAS